MTRASLLVLAGLLGAIGVIAGAAGAHFVARDDRALDLWHTATHYHQLHALALLGLSALPWRSTRTVLVIAGSWCVGLVAFSGSLYWLALAGPPSLAHITPFGGGSFIVGWFALAFLGWREHVGPAAR